MDSKQRQLIKKYVDLVINKWWLIAVSVLVTVTAGLGYYLYLPKIFQSTSLLSYEQQQINPARMDPEQGRNRLDDALATLRELVTSRNSLEKVITQFSLYEEVRQRLPIDDVIISMRKNISITPAIKGDIFSVSFQGTDPQKVMKVTNSLASLFIEENLRYREERATETSKYTQDELAMAKKVLDERELLMRDYKLKNFNEMPEQRESNIARLQALTIQNQGIQNSIQELERTKVMSQEQMAWTQRMAIARSSSESVAAGSGASSARQPETDVDRLQRLRGYLSELLGKYTEQHPEVRRTKQLIEQLEKQTDKAPPASRQVTGSASNRSSISESLESQRSQLQIKGIEANIKQLREEQSRIPAEIAKYQRWVEAAPVREAEWNALTRDYNELRRNYDQLVQRNLQAQSAQNMEHNQKGSKFKIVESARFSEKPFKPNFLKILMVTIAAGLALSVGSILGLSIIDTSFKDVEELEEYLGVPVVCAIAYIEKETETKKDRRLFLVSVTLVSIYGVALLTAIVYLWKKGMIIV